MSRILGILFVALSTSMAHAGGFVDLSTFIKTDSLAATSTSTGNDTIYDISIGLTLDKDEQYQLGWNLSTISLGLDTGTATTFGSSDMGFKFGWYFTKELAWSLFFTYNLIVTATFNNGTSTEEWRGTSYKAELGYTPKIGNMFAGGRLIFYTSTITEAITNSTTITTVAYTRTIMYPALIFGYYF